MAVDWDGSLHSLGSGEPKSREYCDDWGSLQLEPPPSKLRPSADKGAVAPGSGVGLRVMLGICLLVAAYGAGFVMGSASIKPQRCPVRKCHEPDGHQESDGYQESDGHHESDGYHEPDGHHESDGNRLSGRSLEQVLRGRGLGRFLMCAPKEDVWNCNQGLAIPREVTEEDMALILDNTPLEGLRVVDLGSCRLSGPAIALLARSLPNSVISFAVGLNENGMADVETARLMGAPGGMPRHLQRLFLEDTGLTAQGLSEVLSDRLRTDLMSLYVDHNPGLGDEGARVIADRIRDVPQLWLLHLINTGLTDKGAELLAGAIPTLGPHRRPGDWVGSWPPRREACIGNNPITNAKTRSPALKTLLRALSGWHVIFKH